MGKKIFGRKKPLMSATMLVILALTSGTIAWGDQGGHRQYRYHDGRYYRPGVFGFEVAVDAPPIGAVITVLPDGYTTYVIGGVPYYYWGGSYFRPSQYGYVVVEQPVGALAPPVAPAPLPPPQETSVTPSNPPQSLSSDQNKNETNVSAKSLSNAPEEAVAIGDTVTVNVPNSHGGFTPVKLVKHRKGYTGPQGEYYMNHPTVTQLKVLYGD